ncbi:hypothetical protein SNEBB_008025 [Seison nebaliae]|nr:hypothetical protein SNEBB_008025 [Seison nebaliae]
MIRDKLKNSFDVIINDIVQQYTNSKHLPTEKQENVQNLLKCIRFIFTHQLRREKFIEDVRSPLGNVLFQQLNKASEIIRSASNKSDNVDNDNFGKLLWKFFGEVVNSCSSIIKNIYLECEETEIKSKLSDGISSYRISIFLIRLLNEDQLVRYLSQLNLKHSQCYYYNTENSEALLLDEKFIELMKENLNKLINNVSFDIDFLLFNLEEYLFSVDDQCESIIDLNTAKILNSKNIQQTNVISNIRSVTILEDNEASISDSCSEDEIDGEEMSISNNKFHKDITNDDQEVEDQAQKVEDDVSSSSNNESETVNISQIPFSHQSIDDNQNDLQIYCETMNFLTSEIMKYIDGTHFEKIKHSKSENNKVIETKDAFTQVSMNDENMENRIKLLEKELLAEQLKQKGRAMRAASDVLEQKNLLETEVKTYERQIKELAEQHSDLIEMIHRLQTQINWKQDTDIQIKDILQLTLAMDLGLSSSKDLMKFKLNNDVLTLFDYNHSMQKSDKQKEEFEDVSEKIIDCLKQHKQSKKSELVKFSSSDHSSIENNNPSGRFNPFSRQKSTNKPDPTIIMTDPLSDDSSKMSNGLHESTDEIDRVFNAKTNLENSEDITHPRLVFSANSSKNSFTSSDDRPSIIGHQEQSISNIFLQYFPRNNIGGTKSRILDNVFNSYLQQINSIIITIPIVLLRPPYIHQTSTDLPSLKTTPTIRYHHVYPIFIRINSMQWYVVRRYSEILAFYEQNMKQLKLTNYYSIFKSILPKFPKKTNLLINELDFLEHRRIDLKVFLQQFIYILLNIRLIEHFQNIIEQFQQPSISNEVKFKEFIDIFRNKQLDRHMISEVFHILL